MKRIITSRYFLLAVFSLFVLQGVVYTFSSKYGLPHDEKFHFESIQYYAEEPVAEGPFVDNQPQETIYEVNVIERSATYLYHYILSFPARLMNEFDISYDTQIIVFRIINIFFCVLALVVLKKVLDELSDNTLLKNLSVAALSLTGVFVFLAGSINYDNLANLLFLAFLLFATRSIKKTSQNEFAWATIFGLATILTKYTFLPVVGLGLIVALAFLLKRRHSVKGYYAAFKNTYSSHKVATLVCLGLLVTTSFLFVERVGLNLVEYKQVQPSCTKIFTTEECYENFSVYRRGVDHKAAFIQEGGLASADLSMFSQAGEWTDRMYKGLFYYFGQHRVGDYLISAGVAFLVFLAFIVTLTFRRQRIILKREHLFILGLSITYISLLFLFNLKTYLTLGERFAYQGRYLLPIMGFVYFFAGLIILQTYKASKFKKPFIVSWTVLLVLMLLTHLPALNFYQYLQDAGETSYKLKPFDIRYTERPKE